MIKLWKEEVGHAW